MSLGMPEDSPPHPIAGESSYIRDAHRRNSSSIILPVEICERIIDLCVIPHYTEIGPDIDIHCYGTLRACALTCRSWLPRSRYHIYYKVDLCNHEGLVLFLSALNSNTELCTFVRELAIFGQEYATSCATWISLLPHSLPSKLIKLGRITLVNYPAAALHQNLYVLLAQFTAVTTLCVRSTMLPSIADLTRLILAFPNLTHVHLVKLWLRSPSLGGQPPSLRRNARRPQLQCLSIEHCNQMFESEIIPWLIETLGVSSLAHFTYALCVDHEDAARVGKLLQSCAAALEALTVTLDSVGSCQQYAISDHLDLSRNKNLRALRVKLSRRDNDFGQVAKMLSTVSSQHINKITVETDNLSVGSLDALDWKGLEIALMHATFTSLTDVNVEWGMDDNDRRDGFDHGVIQRQISSHLPELYARGILHVSVLEWRFV